MEEKKIVRRSSHRNRVEAKELIEEILEETTLDLKYPISVATEAGDILEIEKFVFPPRLRVKHLRGIPSELFDSEADPNFNPIVFLPFISILTDIDVKFLEELDVEDINNILDKVRKLYGFF